MIFWNSVRKFFVDEGCKALDALLPCVLYEDDETSLAEFLACQKRVQSNVHSLNVIPNVKFLSVMSDEAYDVNENAFASIHLMSISCQSMMLLP